jgi:arylsulfatase
MRAIHLFKGAITDQVGHVIDILPTICEVAGIEVPGEYKGLKIIPAEGRSLVPVLKGKVREAHEWLFWEHIGNKAARHGKWKLVGRGNPKDAKDLKNWQLFDLEADRTEVNNLAESNPERLKQMVQAWHAWARRTKLIKR